MSIKFIGQKAFLTSSAPKPAQTQTKCSISFKFRYDGDNTKAGGAYVFYRLYYAGPTIIFIPNSSGGVDIAATWYTANNTRIDFRKEFSAGAVHCFVMTFDGVAGVQKASLDAVTVETGNFIGSTSGPYTRTNQVGGNENSTLTNDCAFTIEDLVIWDGYVLTQQDIEDLRDENKSIDEIGSSAERVHWPLKGTPGSVVVPNQGGLKNAFSDTLHFITESGNGSAVYGENLKWSPTSLISEAYVTTCGKLLAIRCKSVAGSISTPKIIHRIPIIKVNDVVIPELGDPVWITGFHTSILIPLPFKLNKSDKVTISVSGGWMETNDGLVGGVTNFAAGNRIGKSSFGSEAVKRTLKVGVNFSFTGSGSDVLYSIPKNLVKRLGFWNSGTGTTIDGKPTTLLLGGNQAYAGLFEFGGDNGIDNSGHPITSGLHAIGWDDPDPNNPDEWWLESLYGTGNEANTSAIERIDLKNTGSIIQGERVGNVRVLDIQPVPGYWLNMQVVARVRNNSGTSRAKNLVVYGPNDFTYQDNIPVTLDKSNPHALSNVFLKRFANGAGAFRWMDTLTYYTGSSSACDVEHLISMDDFRWGYNRNLYNSTIRFIQARPYVPTLSYIYSPVWGDKYDVVLAEPIDNATQTTIKIRWSDTNPVIPRLRLYIQKNDGTEEVIRIVSIPDNPVDGQVVDVVVQRGQRMTIASSHAAGTIKAGYRVAGPSMNTFVFGKGICYELVTDKPHDLWTGAGSALAGLWPRLTLADGNTFNPLDAASSFWVTGPKTLMLATWYPNTVVTTLGNTKSLDPNACTAKTILPHSYQPSIPFEYAAYVTGKISGCDLWLNIPPWATDDLVIEIARRVRDRFPVGRNVFVEWCNEPWNNGFPQSAYIVPMSKFLYNFNAGSYSVVCHQTKRIGDLFEAVFNEGGRNRGGEIKRTINFQPRSPMQPTLEYAQTMNPPLNVDACATAPYIGVPDGDYASLDHQTSICQFRWDTEQCIDLYTHHLNHNVGDHSFPKSFVMQKSHIDAYNAITGLNCKLVGYEGGVEFPITVKEITPPGTVSIDNNSNIVRGVGTKFRKYFIAGQSIVIRSGSNDRMYTVERIDSDTYLLLTENYAGPTESGLTYRLSSFKIIPMAGTVAVENGKPTIIGSGTSFDQSLVGKLIGIRQPDGIMRYGFPHHGVGPYHYFFVKSVADSTHLTLQKNWNGSTNTGCLLYEVHEHVDTKTRDMVYHPNWYFNEFDMHKLVQDSGFYRMCYFCYSGGYFRGRYMWPMYTHINQDYGRGDGSDGKADNRLVVAEPGLPNSKEPMVNKDARCVSVRGKALLDWNKSELVKPPRSRFRLIPRYWFTIKNK